MDGIVFIVLKKRAGYDARAQVSLVTSELRKPRLMRSGIVGMCKCTLSQSGNVSEFDSISAFM